MIPELGHFLLIIAAMTALLAPAVVFYGIRRGDDFYVGFSRPASLLTALMLTLSTAALVWAFLTDDFSVAYVANHSNTKLAPAYKAAALWGSHEGSMLLWIWLMAVGTVGAGFVRCADRLFTARLQGLMLAVLAGFCAFLLFTSNPFLRNLPMVPPDGRDLNPILQDIGMILHPPVLFMGYAGLALMFAAMCALLLSGRWSKTAIDFTTRLSIVTWGFLTAGNMLGSWWAYNELGWGGWWFWDPVENASFIPWLTTTALMHALIQTRRRGQLRRLTVFLTLVGFALCLLGTFLVRSGAMQSVHAFATDPGRGIALQVLAIVLLVPAAFAVLFGTLYPLGYEVFAGRTLTVGAPYFNNFFAPMTLIAAALAGAAQLGLRNPVRWAVCAAASVAAGAAVALLTDPRSPVMTGFAVTAAVWLVVTAVSHCLPFQARRMSLAALLAHVGIAVSIAGAVGVEQYESEALVRMGPGLGKPVDDVVFVYTETRFVNNHSYFGQQGVIEVLRLDDESLITTLRPERQTFVANGMQMSAAGIDHGFLRDYYVSMGNKLTDTEWLVRLSIKPLAGWIWGGGAVMILAALIILFTRRRETETAAQELEAPSK